MNTLALMCIAFTSTRPSFTPLFVTAASTCGVRFTNPRRAGRFMKRDSVCAFTRRTLAWCPMLRSRAAAFAVLLPGHLHGTFGCLVGYAAPGSLAIPAFLALGAAALGGSGPRARRRLGAGAGVPLGVGAGAWRVSLLAPPLVAAFVLLWV